MYLFLLNKVDSETNNKNRHSMVLINFCCADVHDHIFLVLEFPRYYFRQMF